MCLLATKSVRPKRIIKVYKSVRVWPESNVLRGVYFSLFIYKPGVNKAKGKLAKALARIKKNRNSKGIIKGYTSRLNSGVFHAYKNRKYAQREWENSLTTTVVPFYARPEHYITESDNEICFTQLFLHQKDYKQAFITAKGKMTRWEKRYGCEYGTF